MDLDGFRIYSMISVASWRRVEVVRAEKNTEGQLFAKIPFPFSGQTKNDRLSSSVNKQPMDYYEVNCYRGPSKSDIDSSDVASEAFWRRACR